MKFLKYLGYAIAALVVLAGIAWLLRTDPMGPLAGKMLSGAEQPYPDDWSFVDSHPLCALETRVDDPHSVTTICFVHEGSLMIPASEGSTKTWPKYVLADARVRVKVGESVYPARAVRVTEIDTDAVMASALTKYGDLAADGGAPPPDIWLFQISGRDDS
jgi:hypothetical protein